MRQVICTDCHEVNEAAAKRCIRCGRSLEDAVGKVDERFEVQHSDAPNVMSERNRPQKKQTNSTVW